MSSANTPTVPIFQPSREVDLLRWSANFDDKITAGSPAIYGLDAAQASAYHALHMAYESAFLAANNPNTNSKANVNAKNVAKEQLVYGPGGARELVNIVQAFPATTDAMRGELGLRIADTKPTPVLVPSSAPDLSILSTFGRRIKVRLRDQDSPDRRGKPTGARGAVILYQVADSAEPGHTSPSSDPAKWTFGMITSRTVFDIEIPATVAAGSRVWLTAFWFNARKDSSPYATPETTIIGDGVSRLAA